MTNINCTRNCKFQQEGKCCFDSITTPITNFSIISDCPYQAENNKENSASFDLPKRADRQL